MRGIQAAGVGVGLLLTSAGALGQEVRPGRLRFVPSTPVASRAQMPDPAPPTGPLGTPRPLGSPTVTVEPGTPAPPATAPLMNNMVPMPVQGVPAPGMPIPGMAVPGMPVPPGYPVQNPVPYSTPGYSSIHPTAVAPAPVYPPVHAIGDGLFGTPPQLDTPLYAGVAGGAAPGFATGFLAGPDRWSFSAELLLWWVQSQRVPTLVTTSGVGSSGILGRPDTRALFGGDTLSTSVQPGGRFGATYWLNPERTVAVDGSLFFLRKDGKEFRTNTNQNPLLARPFQSANTSLPFAQIVAAPGLATGGVVVRPSTDVWGAEVNIRHPLLVCDPCRSFDLFGGFRYFHLNDTLLIGETFARTPDSPSAIGSPNALFGTVSDRFRTENDFYGAQMGFQGERRLGSRWFAQYRASIALGTVFQSVEIDGGQIIQTPTGLTTATGGLLALPGANIGRFSQRQFGVMPEASLRLGCYVTPRLRATVGYNFMYLNSVLRAGDQIDPILDVNRIPNFPLPPNQTAPAPSVRPTVPMRTTDVFVQGISLGLQYTW